MDTDRGYELLDVGGGARLERFGDRVVDRPHPGALGARHDPGRWLAADLRFDRDRGWTGPAIAAGPWSASMGGVTLELRPTEAGQVGCFPEQRSMLPWLADRAAAANVLHLFASTGLVTLALAAGGSSVTHVDASRPTVAWARRNADLSGLGDRPVRWIVDDVRAFVARESRRGRRYDGVVLDPPSYGHGAGGRPWRLEDELRALLGACGGVLTPSGFVLLTAHTPGFDADRLANELRGSLRRPAAAIEAGELALATADGRVVDLGAFARAPGGA